MDNLIESVEIMASLNQHTISQLYRILHSGNYKFIQINKIYFHNFNKTEHTAMMHNHTQYVYDSIK